MKTKVLSVRVPEEFASSLQLYCKSNKTSVSQYMQEGFKTVGMVALDDIPMESEISELLLSTGGGSLVGILAYKGIKHSLKDKYTEGQIETFATLGGIAIALFSAIGINKLMKILK